MFNRSQPNTHSSSSLLSPLILEEAKRIELRMRRRVDNVLIGRYRSAFKGSGITFSDLREYQPGDDVKHIHWKVSARSDRVYVKSYEEERQLTVILAVDTSASTHIGSNGGRFYKELEFAALISVMCHSARDQIGICLFSDTVEEFIPPTSNPQQLRRVIATLLKPSPKGKKTDVNEALLSLHKTVRKPSIIFVVSDFYSPPFSEGLERLARQHDVICTCIENPLDMQLPSFGIVEFEDAESGERIVLDTSTSAGSAQLAAYHSSRIEALRNDCRKSGADLLVIKDRVFPALSALMRSRQISRRR